jgi:steroid delta-isomerase-like uncharacterized protein
MPKKGIKSTIRGRAKMSEANKDLFRRGVEDIWNRKIPGSIEKYISPKYVSRKTTGEIHGVAELQKFYENYVNAFPDCRMEIQELISEGDVLAFHYAFTGTHKGAFRDIPASGKSIAVHGVGIMRFENGQAVEERIAWDSLSLMQQIGAA